MLNYRELAYFDELSRLCRLEEKMKKNARILAKLHMVKQKGIPGGKGEEEEDRRTEKHL